MKALIKRHKQPGLWLEDIPTPTIKPDSVLVKVLRTGICGTDLHIYDWDEWAASTVPAPLTIGHEFVGIIDKIGARVKNLQPGTVVSGEGHLVCGRCTSCATDFKHLCSRTKVIGVHVPGAFAEYIAMPAKNIWTHAATVPLDVAAIFDPFGNAVHSVDMFDVKGKDVLITGAGPIGVMSVAVARKRGARTIVVTDVNNYRLGLARQVGAHEIVNVTHQSLNGAKRRQAIRNGFTVGLEMSGNATALNDMIAHAAPGCNIAALGLPSEPLHINWSGIVTKMITLRGVFGRHIFATWEAMADLIKDGLDISGTITHRFLYHEYEKAFATARSGEAGKIILDWENA